MTAGATPDPSASRRPGPTDPSIRRTWWLLSGVFLLLGVVALLRFVGSRSWVDFGLFLVILVAAVAAVGHRNAVAGLEARGRAEAESFARILRGLSRSVSSDAIVAAILEDLVDATGADHVVVVRRRQDGSGLDATLVTRRSGVPTTMTTLPASDLDGPIDWTPAPVVVAVGPGPMPAPDPGRDPDGAEGAAPDDVRPLVALPEAGRDGSDEAARPIDGRPFVRRAALVGRDAIPGPFSAAVAGAGTLDVPAAAAIPRPHPAPGPASLNAGATDAHLGDAHLGDAHLEESGGERAGRFARTAFSEALELLVDLGVPLPRRRQAGDAAAHAEVVGSGLDAAVAARIAQRVRSVFALSQTLSTALRTDQGLIGAIVLSRRDRSAWSQSSRRLLRGAAIEASSALARADSQRETEAQAATDSLTGLPNRRYFDEFTTLLARRRRAGDAVSVLMIDIDKFKVLNDTYGHPVGDEVLRAVGQAIVSTIREQDVPARVGGEEFAVLLRNPGPDISMEVGERVREAVRALDLSEHGVPGVSVSVGVADSLGPEESITDIVGRADNALLRAKRSGRDRVVAAG